ncbi:hypothetical protein MPC1_2900003 [Methylocella tundrae]|nr:hypothetical protein MPC1_2900003 [Methylocella tundrae]
MGRGKTDEFQPALTEALEACESEPAERDGTQSRANFASLSAQNTPSRLQHPRAPSGS